MGKPRSSIVPSSTSCPSVRMESSNSNICPARLPGINSRWLGRQSHPTRGRRWAAGPGTRSPPLEAGGVNSGEVAAAAMAFDDGERVLTERLAGLVGPGGVLRFGNDFFFSPSVESASTACFAWSRTLPREVRMAVVTLVSLMTCARIFVLSLSERRST